MSPIDGFRPSRLLIFGLAAVAVAVILGLVLVQRVGTTYRDGLAVAADSAALAVDAADPVSSMTTDLVAFARAAETGIADARETWPRLRSPSSSSARRHRASSPRPPPGLAGLADRVAGVIEGIERFIPGNSASAAEDLRRIADGLEPVPTELQDLGAQLETTATSWPTADPTLVELEETVAGLGDDLDELAPAVDNMAATADRLAQRVEAANDRVDLDLWLARLVIVLVGAAIATGLVLADRRAA